MKIAVPEGHDGFLSDVNNLHYEIHCFHCKVGLWETKILKRIGAQVGATDTQKLGDNPIAFSSRITACPMCGKTFFARAKSGGQMYLIKCLKSGIKRLI